MGNTPLWFHCPVGRRNQVWLGGYEHDGRRAYRIDTRAHRVSRTGRAKPAKARRPSARTLREAHEYVCSCGHKGWSTHVDILRQPLVRET